MYGLNMKAFLFCCKYVLHLPRKKINFKMKKICVSARCSKGYYALRGMRAVVVVAAMLLLRNEMN